MVLVVIHVLALDLKVSLVPSPESLPFLVQVTLQEDGFPAGARWSYFLGEGRERGWVPWWSYFLGEIRGPGKRMGFLLGIG